MPKLRTRTRTRAAAALALLAAAGFGAAGLARSGLADPAPTRLLLDRAGGFLGEVPGAGEERLGLWPVEGIPPRVAAATIAVEDRRFFQHPGVDPLAIARAALGNLTGRGARSGASTLAMQVARLQDPGPRTLPRKLREAAAALALTARQGRSGVLRQYLRLAPYGNRIHGIAYAARRYFEKPAEDLSWAEAALLAAVPQAPARLNPAVPDGRARAAARGRRILDRLRDAGRIGPAEHALAAREIGTLALAAAPLPRRPPETLHAVLRLARDLGAAGNAGAGPLVRTTIDPVVQEETAAALADALARLRADGAGNAAAVVLDARDASVLAWAGSAGYFDPVGSGAIDYAALARPAGSSLKPFLFALALERGAITPATALEDAPRGPGGVENADRDSLGTILPRFALANSRNVPAVRLFERVGAGDAWGRLADLGLAGPGSPPRSWGAGLALGAFPVTLEALVRAYAAFPADGRLRSLRWTLDAPTPEPRRVMSEAAARQVTLFLADPLARLPGFPRRGPTERPYPVAAKTGTSSGPRDAWTVAWSRRAVVGVWVGRADFRPMRGASGYGSAAGIAARILDALHRDELQGLADRPFPPPRGHRLERLCARSGGAPGPACDRVTAEWLSAAAPTPGPCSLCAVAAGGAPPSPGPRVGDAAPRLRVRSPEEGTTLLVDPETPRAAATIALEAEVEPAEGEVVWYVDGSPWRTVGRPYSARWPLASGAHVFQVRLADREGRSPPVHVLVR